MRTITLTFDEYPDDEIEVRVSPVPLRQFFDVQSLMGKIRGPETFDELFAQFAPFLVRWTFPEPTDKDGLWARDMNLTLAIIKQWAAGVAEAPLPLPLPSSDGTPSKVPQA